MNIYNFCIIAHIDHGKSTLADRLMEFTGTVEKRKMREQMLDSMELEREKGITIKLQPVRMSWPASTAGKHGDILNLIDTPGHVDFQYEVSRSLQAVEGAVLLVDATQGVQAQTVSNLYLALGHDLRVIPVINKIDLPAADVAACQRELQDLLGVAQDEILLISAKTGEGVKNLLDEIVRRVPAATIHPAPLRALIFDSVYDDYKGVVAYVRVISGNVKRDQAITFLGTDAGDRVVEVGTFAPEFAATDTLSAGEIGYVATGLKNIREARVGDTMTLTSAKNEASALPGFAIPQPKVFAGIFAADGSEFAGLREALQKLQLNDASLSVQPERSTALGQGFRCGFLGLLHLEIIQERLRREFGLKLIITTPSVQFDVTLQTGETIAVHTADEFPDPSQIAAIREQYCLAEIIVPSQYLGPVFEVLRQHEGTLQRQEPMGTSRMTLTYRLPLRELVVDLYDQIKSATSGYGSLSYELVDWQEADVIKLSIMINHEAVEALSVVVPRAKALAVGRRAVEKLKAALPKQLFTIPIQAAIGGKVVARETVPAMRKDVTAKLYGGDVTRKRKLLEKQKKGKKKLAAAGSVEIPPEAYIAMLKR